LDLDVAGKTVLEVGAGAGQHTSFFLDRGCRVLSTDGRIENVQTMRAIVSAYGYYGKFENLELGIFDVENPGDSLPEPREIVYCYGLLYHTARPVEVLRMLAGLCTELFLLETSVETNEQLNVASENQADVSQSIHGQGSHPSREIIFATLQELFQYVYVPKTQPWHEYFPTDWKCPERIEGQTMRGVFIGSRRKIENGNLLESLPDRQSR
jgi:hypothetical protein